MSTKNKFEGAVTPKVETTDADVSVEVTPDAPAPTVAP